MKIKILGTCAAEGWPALFCDCEACRKARKLGGKNIRTRSSIQIDDDLKIDFPPDTMHHAIRYNQELSKLKYLLITHSHSDHLCADELVFMAENYAWPPVMGEVRIAGNATAMDIIRKAIHRDAEKTNILTELEPFQEFDLPPYKVTTLKAAHAPGEDALNYIIEKKGKRFLYTCDSGFYEDSTWDFLSDQRVDLVITECTGGPNRVDYKTHMGFPNVLDLRARFEQLGFTDENTPWVLTHFSHNGGLMHHELEELVRPEGFEVAWDGLELNI